MSRVASGVWITIGQDWRRLDPADGSQVWSVTDRSARDIVVDPNGTSIIGSDGSGKEAIQLRNSVGAGSWVYSLSPNPVYGVTFAPGGFVYGGDIGDNLTKVDSAGTLVWQVDLGNNVYCVATDSLGNVYPASSSGIGARTVHKLTSAGATVWTYTGFAGSAFAIQVDRTGNVIFGTSTGDIHKLSPAGSLVWTYAAAPSVKDVAIDADGAVYVAAGSTVIKVSADGALVWTYSGHTGGVNGVDVDPDGNVYSASADDTVRRLTSAGSLVWSVNLGADVDTLAAYPAVGTFPGAWAEEFVRMAVQEDAGSILESTEAVPSEVSASMALEKDQTLTPGELTLLPHPLGSTYLLAAYPHAVPNVEHFNTYVFETKIGRMTRTFPPKLWERVDKITALASDLRNEDGDLDAGGDRVTAQAALQYIFNQWSSTYDWFTAETVPDLRTWWPSEDYSGTNGVVYVLAIRLRQEQNRRKSMLDILREWLSPFSITPRQNSSENIELVPQHGPDADAAPTKTLTDGDITWPGLSDGGADERFAKNLVNVTNQGDARSEDVQVMESAWIQIASNYNLGHADVLYTPPAGVRNLSPGKDGDGNDDETTTAAHGLTANVDPFCAQGCSWFWAVGADSIAAGDEGILLTSSSGTKQITAEFIAGDSNGNIDSSGTVAPSDVEVNTIPYSGETVDAIILTHVDTRAVIRGRWDEAAQGVFLSWGGGTLETSMFLPPRFTWTFGINLQDASVGITEGPVVNATVGTTDDSGEVNATIPGTDGGNAIVQSQAANGINEATIDIRVYTLEPTALTDIGLGYLRDNIDPRVIRTGEQSPENGMPIVPDDIGHLVQLGDGSEAIVLSCGFTVDFSPGHDSPVLRSAVRFLVVTDPVIDTTSTFLHFADGSYFILADGTISEEA